MHRVMKAVINVASTARSSCLLLGSSVETLRHSVSVVSVSVASA